MKILITCVVIILLVFIISRGVSTILNRVMDDADQLDNHD